MINPIEEQIANFIMQHYPLAKKKQIHADTPLLDFGVIDSMGIIDLVTFLEDSFLLSVSDSDISIENFRTIGNLAAFVESKVRTATKNAA
jgi:acyl carrier protein